MIMAFQWPWPHEYHDDLIDNDSIQALQLEARSAIGDKRFGLIYHCDTNLDAYRNLLRCRWPQFADDELHVHLAVQPAGYCYPPHCDHPDKLQSMITYIYPFNSIGTYLHTDAGASTSHECEWRVGRTLVWQNMNGRWHSYRSGSDQTRVTLCAFFVRAGTNPTGRT